MNTWQHMWKTSTGHNPAQKKPHYMAFRTLMLKLLRFLGHNPAQKKPHYMAFRTLMLKILRFLGTFTNLE